MHQVAFARLPWMLWMLSALAGLVGLSLMVWNRQRFGEPTYLYWGADLVVATLFPLVGALIVSRQPRNPIGWLLCGAGLSSGLGGSTGEYATYALHTQAGSPMLTAWAAWFSHVSSYVFFVALIFLLLLFPNGQPVTPRWRIFLWGVGIGSTLVIAAAAVKPGPIQQFPTVNNPLGMAAAAPLIEWVEMGGDFLLLASLVAGPISLFLRFHRSRGLERQQVKWMAFAATCGLSSLFLNGLFPNLAWLIGGTSMTLVVLAIGIAVLRYHLYDLDVIINKTLVYGTLTGTLALCYFGGIVLLQQLFRLMTGQESQFVIVVSTLAIAALFNPLRHRIQSFIDRRFYRRKYDAQKTLAAFSASLRSSTNADLEHLTGELVRIIEETVQPVEVTVWLRKTEL